jgi:hypothetical protein
MPFGEFLIYALLYLVKYALPLFLLIAIYIHNLFPKKIDKDLFNEKYFTQFELQTFSTFPLSILKTLAYIRGTIAPQSIIKRFHGYDFKANMPKHFYWLCVVYPVIPVLFFIFGIALSIFVLVDKFF